MRGAVQPPAAALAARLGASRRWARVFDSCSCRKLGALVRGTLGAGVRGRAPVCAVGAALRAAGVRARAGRHEAAARAVRRSARRMLTCC